MGLGKTYTGAEKLIQIGAMVNLVVCQKSKVNDWVEHFREHYQQWTVFDATSQKKEDKRAYEYGFWMNYRNGNKVVPSIIVINYDLLWRRPELKKLKDFTLMLDESSLIQNENSKRSRFILGLKPKNVILLSGTPCGGKYELLWSQMHLLGWKISKSMYWDQYVRSHYEDVSGFPLKIVDGYKNVDRLKRKMREHGCLFLKTEEVMDLPEQVFQRVYVPVTTAYKKFMRDRIITMGDKELVGDTTLTKLLYARMLCGLYSKEKLEAFRDLIESTDDRVIVFYNFTAELDAMQSVLIDMYGEPETARRCSIVSGEHKALKSYETYSDSITFVQYQSGSMGLNLQKACRIIYFTPPLSSELWMQSQKRIHRINQKRTCFYYQLICRGSVEEKIYRTLKMRKNFTEELFMNECL